jgi:two-component system LytT family response regulator
MADQIRVMLVDDEAPARNLLREYLGAHPDVEIVGECVNGFDAVRAIGEQRPDLVFLDIQMPKLDGFEVLELLDSAPAVVFCTAYDEYALKAFEVHALDYLLKPFGRERLAEALAHVRARRAGGTIGQSVARSAGMAADAPASVGVLSPTAIGAAARRGGQFLERIVVKEGADVHVIPVDRVEVLEAQDDYVAIHVAGKIHLKHAALAELGAALDPARFVRVHRSYVVSLERIARIELMGKDARVAVLRDGREIPVSRKGYERLRELLR